jgi:peroxiredoxin
LQRWESFRPEFEKFGVRMIAVSPDNVKETRGLQKKLGAGIRLLADEDLKLIERFGVRHEKGIAPTARGVLRPLSVPTTILVDGAGVVRWIDQTDDYRLRSDADRVLAAVESNLN